MATIRKALISVSDKEGIVDFARGLTNYNVDILSTGGTAKLLRDQGISVTDVSEYTGFPEMLDGRVKTLHPKVHGGLLGRRDLPQHREKMAAHGIDPIDLVVVNLYPFEATVAKPDCSFADAIENIDIGGPTMLRSAAKNFRDVTVVIDPDDYRAVLDEMKAENGGVSSTTNFRLAKKVFQATARYDAAISNYLGTYPELDCQPEDRLVFPETFTYQGLKVQDLRYGENPHQKAAFYHDLAVTEPCIGSAIQLQGKELSFNNILDSNAAFELVKEFSTTAAVVIKHNNPCGAAQSPDGNLVEAYCQARACDPVSAFGGIAAFNIPVDRETAEEIASTFMEAVIAPDYSPEALAVLGKKDALRLLKAPLGAKAGSGRLEFKKVVGGLLLQDRDLLLTPPSEWRTVSQRQPSEQELVDLLFAWKISKHVKSNAIVFARHNQLVGVGAGQMSRVDSVNIAVMKALSDTAGTVVGSDAFFPFRDGIDAAAKAGATAIIQPGGSARDDEAIAAVNEHNMAMVFTGTRHFKH
ncbi:MAG: bifunctional phosphoribosylaminoimidazolecarboxamide formyltransferase/IMP cyclohydrolase [Deltaproteobacteria bacterium]|nr:bifunctional phosphoribosylaminoimidazolecarboxamide formyltransferase/IMP cyclohydrolase [Candidatus Anaeroferrophillus wilburensis]MBN2888460.1 bifunctional phosphoribosylaminoimidazolecarboxamide formyltransferase/IMP cyclohydrolase [Deltaproteobacteria bacterium]